MSKGSKRHSAKHNERLFNYIFEKPKKVIASPSPTSTGNQEFNWKVEGECEKLQQAKIAALTLVNDPSFALHMTSDEWNKLHRDFKSIMSNGQYRYRSAMRNSQLQAVFLTDKPIKTYEDRSA
jgi:hypothetical protein